MTHAYDTGLERQPANHQPLTPLTYLERTAATYPDHVAIIHGDLRTDLPRLLAPLAAARFRAWPRAASARAIPCP